MFKDLIHDLNKAADSKRAKLLARYFKTGKGEYGEGDIFIGITVPKQREIADKYSNLSLKEVEKLLKNKIHEYRSVALMILVEKYENPLLNQGEGGVLTPGEVVSFYLKNLKYINNWDLVDGSAADILGNYFFTKSKEKLYYLAKSKNMWERRIAIISTFYFIKQNKFTDTLKIGRLLLNDGEDLIHKACGWMLREVGKRDEMVLKKFLNKNATTMPRTMLRYAIERFKEGDRKKYLVLK